MIPEIKIYGPIGGDDEGAVTSKDVLAQLNEIDSDEIAVRINSDGGSVNQGIAIVNALRKHPAKIHTIVEGAACSIAGYIACSGDIRTIEPNSMLHIHGPQYVTEGNLEDHEDSIESLKVATKAMSELYSEISGEKTKDIESDFRRDVFMDADQAVDRGYMTEIGEENKIAALVDTTKFKKFPKRFSTASVERRKSNPKGEEMSKTPATIKAMKAKFKSASAEFILAQAEKDSTMEDSTAAYLTAMEEENTELKAAVADLKTEMEAMVDDGKEKEETPDETIARLTAELEESNAEDDDDDILAEEDEDVVASEEDEIKALKAEIIALKKSKKKKGKRFGANAVRTSKTPSRRVAVSTAKAEISRQVTALMDSNASLSKVDAHKAVFKSDPQLRERYVEESNAS